MKKIIWAIALVGVIFVAVNSTAQPQKQNPRSNPVEISKQDSTDILRLIRNVLNWGDLPNSINLLPLVGNSDSICIGFDLEKLNANLEKLRSTNYFSEEFIDNYKLIILTLDRKIKNKEFEAWYIYDVPDPLNFAVNASAWCNCMEVPYDKPNPWDFVEIKVVSTSKEQADLFWTWGNLSDEQKKYWEDDSYNFKVKKENNQWKISYMQGFDFKEATRNWREEDK